jgi:hypothetical protein
MYVLYYHGSTAGALDAKLPRVHSESRLRADENMRFGRSWSADANAGHYLKSSGTVGEARTEKLIVPSLDGQSVNIYIDI